MKDVRVHRHHGWATKGQTVLPRETAETWAEAIKQQLCPICGAGPFVVVASHVYGLHGILAADLRTMLGLTGNTSICDPTYSRSKRAEQKGRWEKGTINTSGLNPDGNPEVLAKWKHKAVEASREWKRANRGKIVSPKRGKPLLANRRTGDEPIDVGHRSHGTPAAYHFGCRCDECRKANRERCYTTFNSMKERLASTDREHGTSSTYSNWGCRCTACCDAWAGMMAEQAARRNRSTVNR